MSSPFVAEIRIFACNFPPTGWAFCDGQLLTISQNTALFSLLGTFYGGDGKTTFALPNLQGTVPVHVGGAQPGPGLSTYSLGEMSGTETVTLLVSEMPLHAHTLNGTSSPAESPDPTGNALGRSVNGNAYTNSFTAQQMAFQALPPAGGSLPHNNMMPYLVLNFCIALQGVYPPRT
jgi:microcystin-dependent protein